MQKVEAQHNQVQNQPAVRQEKGTALASPQSEQIAQLEAMVENSPQACRLAQLEAMAGHSPVSAAQRRAMVAIHNSPYVVAQRQRLKGIVGEIAQREAASAKPNNTGLPDDLKSGIESLSGMSMDNVKVHYNSSQPAQLNAHAYAQGTDIHVAPGQERHLPHEAWHVVQQAQGRVLPTMQMKEGVPVNDDAGLESEADVMGAKALTNVTLQSPALLKSQKVTGQRQTIQRAPELAKVIWGRTHVVRKTDGSLFGAGDFQEGEIGPLGELVGGEIILIDNAKTFRSRRGSHQEEAEKRGMQRGTDPTIIWFHVLELKNVDVASEKLYVRSETIRVESVVDSERRKTLGPMGLVPEHHELVTFADEPERELFGHSKEPVGYAGKMMGKPSERDDFTVLLEGTSEVVLTTGTIGDVEPGAWHRVSIREAEGGGDRRPGLSIINYSDAIYRSGSKLAVCGVRGKVLMDQFGLAIREFAHAKTGRRIKIQTIFNEGAVQENYSRLLDFFRNFTEFQQSDTVVFGYASAFEENGLKPIIRKAISGWVGYLFTRPEGEEMFAVFDSDLTHSYHGEILAQNVKLLLEDPVGGNVSRVIIGGSAGALVAPATGEGDGPEESLKHNAIYIPDGILRPDGYFKENALGRVDMSDAEHLSTLPGSMHTSVVSVLAETPGVLDDLFQYGIKTVDMEFAYVALVLGEVEEPHDERRRDLADVELGVACLVTDFPRTGAKGVALARKDPEAKRIAKKLFVKAVLDSMR